MIKFKKILAVGATVALLALPMFAMGQGVPGGSVIPPASRPDILNQTQGPLNSSTSISGLANTVINVLFTLVMILAVVFILWAAFLFVTSGGDEEKKKSAKGYIIYAVVGIVVALLAKVIVSAVQGVFQ